MENKEGREERRNIVWKVRSGEKSRGKRPGQVGVNNGPPTATMMVQLEGGGSLAWGRGPLAWGRGAPGLGRGAPSRGIGDPWLREGGTQAGGRGGAKQHQVGTGHQGITQGDEGGWGNCRGAW